MHLSAYPTGPGSYTDLQDVGLALSAAHVHDLPLPLGWASKSVYEAVCEEGEGEMAGQDVRSVPARPTIHAFGFLVQTRVSSPDLESRRKGRPQRW